MNKAKLLIDRKYREATYALIHTYKIVYLISGCSKDPEFAHMAFNHLFLITFYANLVNVFFLFFYRQPH